MKRDTPTAARPSRLRLWLLLAASTTAVVTAGIVTAPHTGEEGVVPEQVSSSAAAALIADGQVSSVQIDEAQARLALTLEDDTKVEANYSRSASAELLDTLAAAEISYDIEPLTTPNPWLNLVGRGAFLLLFLALLLFVFHRLRGAPGRFTGKRGSDRTIPDTRFEDVAGVPEVVEDLQDIVELLRDPERYRNSSARMPSGYLLQGPPGTGKTLLARAVAGEAGVPFFSVSGSDFVETYVGVGASRVRKIFDTAREKERAIIFIDEIDAVGKRRGSGHASTEERENTLNQLLVEMDGFQETPGVIVLAATNRADVLDPALTRPGRFDRTITVPPPNLEGRRHILRLYLDNHQLDPQLDVERLAKRTTGMTGADLAQLVNQAALEAAKTGVATLTTAHLDEALETTALGRARRSALTTPEERELTAWHEAGHTVAALLSPHLPDPLAVTITPRGPSGGSTWLANNDSAFHSRQELCAQLVVGLGGRAGEELLLEGDYTSGAQGDLQSATRLATTMVCDYGMSELGLAHLTPERLVAGSQSDVDREVQRLLTDALEEARELLGNHQPLLRTVADTLLEHERIDRSQLRHLADTYLENRTHLHTPTPGGS